VEAARRAPRQASTDARLAKGRQWRRIKGMGIPGAWWVVRAFCGGRAFKHRREVGGFAGFTPTPSHSGESVREPGSTQSGNRHVRWRTTAWAWSGRRLQPDRALSVWWRERCGGGGKRWRRMGMGAVARKVLMALWRFLETGVVPEGARLNAASGLC